MGGIGGSLFSPETSTTQTVTNQQVTTGNAPAVGAGAGRGGGTIGIGGITFGGNLGANLRNVGNVSSKLQNTINSLTNKLTRQNNRLNKLRTGSAAYNNLANAIADTQIKLNNAKGTISSTTSNVNAGTTINVTSTDLNALALASDALHAITDTTHDVLNANQNLAIGALAGNTALSAAGIGGAQSLASQALDSANQANPTIAENKLPLYLIIGAVAIVAFVVLNK